MSGKNIYESRRKLGNLRKQLEEQTASFIHGYWEVNVLDATDLAASEQQRQLCVQMLVERAERLIRLKPRGHTFRVVVAFDLPHFYCPQILVFKGAAYYRQFFNRKNDYQKWIRLSAGRHVGREWRLVIPAHMEVVGFKEIAFKDGRPCYEGEMWFIGEGGQ